MSIFIYLTTLLLGLIKRKSRVITLAFIVIMWIVMGLNTDTPDYSTYETLYYDSNESYVASLEIGYVLFCRICLGAGLTFQQFRMVYTCVYLILLISILKYYTRNINYVLVLVFVYPFIAGVSGLRATMAAIIAFYSTRYLFDQSKKGPLKYVIGILLSMTFHYMTGFFLIFLFARTTFIQDKRKMILMYLSVFTIITMYSNIIYNIASIITSNEKILGWLDMSASSKYEHTNLNGMLVVLFRFAMNYYVYLSSKMIIKRRLDEGATTKRTSKFIFNEYNENVLDNIQILMFFLIPLTAINQIFLRLFYIFIFFSYCLSGYALELLPPPATNKKDVSYKRTFLYKPGVLMLVSVLFSIVLFVLYQIVTPQHNMIGTLVKDNLVFHQ